MNISLKLLLVTFIGFFSYANGSNVGTYEKNTVKEIILKGHCEKESHEQECGYGEDCD